MKGESLDVGQLEGGFKALGNDGHASRKSEKSTDDWEMQQDNRVFKAGVSHL